MKLLIYGGPIDEVEVPEAGVIARRGEPVQIPMEVAERLLEQDTWSEVMAAKLPKASGRKATDAGGEG